MTVVRVCVMTVLCLWLLALAAALVVVFQTEARIQAAERNPLCSDSTRVGVYVFSEPLPSDPDELNEILWGGLLEEDEDIDSAPFLCPVSHWRRRAEAHCRALVRAAAEDSLDADSLRRCLDGVMADRGENAYLPIQCWLVEYEGAPAWVILLNWEYANAPADMGLWHTRTYLMDAATGRRLALSSCA